MSAIDARNFTFARSLQQAALGSRKFPNLVKQDRAAAIELLTRNYLSGSRAAAAAASSAGANLFVGGRDLSRAVSAFSQNLGSVQRGLDAVAAANSALEKIKGLLQQAQGLASSAPKAAPVAEDTSPQPEPEIHRDYLAAEVTGSSVLQSDRKAQVVSAKSILGLGNTLSNVVGQGKTLTVTVGSQTTTIKFGVGGVTTSEQLRTKLDNISGIKASFVDGGYLKIEAAPQENPAAERGFTLGGTADLQTALGLAEKSYSGTSLLTQGLSEGQTLTFQVENGDTQTITFGYGAGQVSSLEELDDALDDLDDVEASIDDENRLTFEVDDDAQASLTLGGTADVEAVFGLAKGVYAPTVIETVVPPEPPLEPQPPAEPVPQPATLDPAIRKSLEGIKKDIEAAIEGASVGGINLLRKGALDIRFEGEAQATRVREGANLSLEALGLESISQHSDASPSEVKAALAQALGEVELRIAQLGNDRSVLEARLGFNEAKLGILEEIFVAEAPDETEKEEGEDQSDIGRIAAETRRLFAESLRPGQDGIVENDRAVLEELFSVTLEKQNP